MTSSSVDEKWKQLIIKGKELARKGRLEESLAVCCEALALRHSDKLVSRIKKIEVVHLQSACVFFVVSAQLLNYFLSCFADLSYLNDFCHLVIAICMSCVDAD